VKADNYAYGPKQDFDAKTDETHVYLPYGNNKKLYSEVRGVLVDAGAGAVAKFKSGGGKSNAVLTYKLHFDKPIGTFRFESGWTEVGLKENTVAGIEYSVDGKAWKPIREVTGAEFPATKAFVAFVKDFKAADLNTQTLYIRYYSRDPKDLEGSGPGRWIHFRTSGTDEKTFFTGQLQVWVKPAKVDASAPAPAATSSAAPAPTASAAPAPAAAPAAK